ncbi:zinc finger CCHC domain-containing protein 7 [Eleginops maclovinus]
MYCMYQDRKELEDDLYLEDEGDSEGSEANSELEFRLYSQLHYSSNAGVVEETGEEAEEMDSERLVEPEKTVDVDGEQEKTGKSRPPSPDLPKKFKKKCKTPDKQQKGQINPNVPRSSTSFLEEVIVIDSGPDVISISEGDTADDDEGVCALKGQSLNRLQTSTPAQQGTQKRSLGAPVTVVSSNSESDSSECESNSESESSDDLENWMILGPGNQDGDKNISLNLEGESNSSADAEEDASWLVSAKDREAGIFNKDKGARLTGQRLPNRYYTNKSVQCRNCDKYGHLSKNCPEPKKLVPCFLCGTPGHLSSECPNKHCNNCGMPGHLYNSCIERAYWHQHCERCYMTGHLTNACPEIWRQYHITTETHTLVKPNRKDRGRTPAYCYNCSRRGHFGHVCTRKRMFNGTYPSTPFINYYDTRKDIKSRQSWIISKAKDLEKNGLLPTSSQTPFTPGPPKKRQKFSHYKSNHQPNHTPRQSPSNHKPGHIFFNDGDFQAPAPKAKWNNRPKQQEGTGTEKPWKPKRPVPTSKSRLPPKKIILNETDDFPRGGGKREDAEKKRKRLGKRTNVPEKPHKGRPHWVKPEEMQGSASKKEKGKRSKRGRARKNANKKDASQMYPTDENLFSIKQRKRHR